jgi:hypothetical protein
MSTSRPGTPGATRECPHCRETILESATVCPACRHHLRFDPNAAASAVEATTALRVEGNIRQPEDGASEYSVVVTVRNDRGDEIARKLIDVGAMQPGEARSFALSVEVTPAGTKRRNPMRH